MSKNREAYYFITLLFVLAVLFACNLSLSGHLTTEAMTFSTPYPSLPNEVKGFTINRRGTEWHCVLIPYKNPMEWDCRRLTPATPGPHFGGYGN